MKSGVYALNNFIEMKNDINRFINLNNSIFILSNKSEDKMVKYQVRQPDLGGDVAFISFFDKKDEDTRGKYRYIGIVSTEGKFYHTKHSYGDKDDYESLLFRNFWKISGLIGFNVPKSLKMFVPKN